MALFGRGQSPRPHLAGPIVAPVLPGATIHTTAVRRGMWSGAGRGRAIAAHLAMAVVAATPMAPPTAKPVRIAVAQRSFWSAAGRVRPIPAHLPLPIVNPAPPAPLPLVITDQSLRRVLVGRTVPRPHVVSPVVAPAPPAPLPVVVTDQSLRRMFVGRSVLRAHLAGPVVAAAVIPPARTTPIRVSQALARPFVGRTVAQPPSVAAPVVVIPLFLVSRPVVVRQALARPFVGRTTVQPPSVAAPLVGALSVPPFDPGTIILRSGRRGGQVHLPSLRTLPTSRIPVHTTPVVVSQAVRRPLVGRRFTTIHLASPVVGPQGAPPVVTVPLVVTRAARARALVGRTTFRPHGAPPSFTLPAQIPLPPPGAVIVAPRAVRRTQLGRTVPRPHLALPVVHPAPVVAAPAANAPPTVVTRMGRRGGHVILPSLQSMLPASRPPLPIGFRLGLIDSTRRRPSGRVVTAPPNLTPAVPPVVTTPTVITDQATRRTRIGRTVPHAHLAPPSLTVGVGSPPLAPSVTVTVQAGRRAVTRRGVPQPHLPTTLGSQGFPPVQVAKVGPVASAFVLRPPVGRTAPRPHLSGPSLAPGPSPTVTAPLVVTDQSLRRVLVGRTVPAAHVAPPNLTPLLGFGTLYNYLIRADGTPVVGAIITARLMPPDAFEVSDSTEILPPLTTVSDHTGFWSLQLTRQSNITVPSYWEITEQVDGDQDRIWAVHVAGGNQTLRSALVTS